MATWDTTFETTPANTNNPGEGAERIRELKTAVRERLELEHSFGADESTEANEGGRHLEGSGRVFVRDGKEAGETDSDRTTAGSRITVPDATPVNDRVGRLFIDLDLLGTAPERNGETDDELITDAMKQVSTIECYDAAGDLVTVIDPATFMSTVIDQTIRGVKTYIDQQLLDTTAWSDNTEYEALSAGEKAIADTECVPRSYVRDGQVAASIISPYDPADYDGGSPAGDVDDQFTTGYSWPSGWGTDWTGAKRSDKSITCDKLWVTEVRAESLYGATYA